MYELQSEEIDQVSGAGWGVVLVVVVVVAAVGVGIYNGYQEEKAANSKKSK